MCSDCLCDHKAGLVCSDCLCDRKAGLCAVTVLVIVKQVSVQ